MRWHEEFNSELWWKRLAASMAVTLLADLRWRSNLPIVLRGEGDDRDEPDVVVLATNWDSQSCRVLNHPKGDLGEAQRNCCLRHFFTHVVSCEPNCGLRVETVGSAKHDCAKELRI